MTTRPGNLGLDSLRYTRGKFLCHLLLITRKDKETLAVTDHDRAITFEGNTYRPIIFGSLSADRREGALRSGDQDAQGIIDEIYITASDLDAQNYLGAEVRQVIVDWTKPFIVLARHRRWIRKMTRTGQSFTATLEGRAQQLQRPQAGRFGGFFTTKCQYRLGGPFCKGHQRRHPYSQRRDRHRLGCSDVDGHRQRHRHYAVVDRQPVRADGQPALVRLADWRRRWLGADAKDPKQHGHTAVC